MSCAEFTCVPQEQEPILPDVHEGPRDAQHIDVFSFQTLLAQPSGTRSSIATSKSGITSTDRGKPHAGL